VETPRLPKQLLDEPGAERLASELEARALPLWARGEHRATRVELASGLEAVLRGAFSAGRIVRGLEGAERVLATEQHGLERVDQTTGIERGGRVSRLLVLSDDGSERFYRSVDFLLRRHAPRVLALRLNVGERALGQLLFGPDQVARLLLVQHKDAVSSVLFALAAQWSDERHGP
jgi:hypothetical protein